ncbi:uncharacterized protein LOC129010029 isoform X2 [Pongo pygmaeus]|uniref:uncharacterized protein LOC129010029 isoform X2 n=1 Tax=Pongo pygmaeus TaxID=9600 RepID=UPI0023E24204|nr:uncharacterized protein LOC129010029 isoform X2 [Pongo pygmaeus]XP_054299692.1 uncharacterized protein LOC129010029 isoform X2 [Pongo pygmaeus]
MRISNRFPGWLTMGMPGTGREDSRKSCLYPDTWKPRSTQGTETAESRSTNLGQTSLKVLFRKTQLSPLCFCMPVLGWQMERPSAKLSTRESPLNLSEGSRTSLQGLEASDSGGFHNLESRGMAYPNSGGDLEDLSIPGTILASPGRTATQGYSTGLWSSEVQG